MFTKLFELAAGADRLGVTVTQLALVVVLLRIGGQKVTRTAMPPRQSRSECDNRAHVLASAT